MKLFCSKCEQPCTVEIGAQGAHLEPNASEQVVTVQCARACFGRWYLVASGTDSLAFTLARIEAATVGPLKQHVTVVP